MAGRTLADVAVCRSMIRYKPEYQGNTDSMHGLPERVPVYGVKRRFQIHKCDMQRLLELSVDFCLSRGLGDVYKRQALHRRSS